MSATDGPHEGSWDVTRHRARWRWVAAVCAALCWWAPSASAQAGGYYLALGDSLASGMQPDAAGADRATHEGYVDVVARHVRAGATPARVVNLGTCGGATARSAVASRRCVVNGRVDTQLGHAERFLRAHRARTILVTVDIGDNDVEGCAGAGGFSAACVTRALASVRRDVATIAVALRSAGGSRVAMVGVVDYDQFLAHWLDGRQGRQMARASVPIVDELNHVVATAYRQGGLAVADAGRRFATDDFGETVPLPGHGRVPRAVSRICHWTWACSPPPIGFDDHANSTGYRVIAQAVLDVAEPLLLDRSGGGPPNAG